MQDVYTNTFSYLILYCRVIFNVSLKDLTCPASVGIPSILSISSRPS